MSKPIVGYHYDLDPRYGWVDIQTNGRKELTIIINGNGFTYRDNKIAPTCICSAWKESECGCPNMLGKWDE